MVTICLHGKKRGGRPCRRCGSTAVPRRSPSCSRRLWPTRGIGERGGRPRRRCRSTSPHRTPSCSWRPRPTRGRGKEGGRPCRRRGSTAVPRRSGDCMRAAGAHGPPAAPHHGNPCPAHSACGRQGGEGMGEGGPCRSCCSSSPRRTPSCSWRPGPTKEGEKRRWRPRRRCCFTSPHRSPSCSWRPRPTKGRGKRGGRPCRRCGSTAVPPRYPSCSRRLWPTLGKGREEGGLLGAAAPPLHTEPRPARGAHGQRGREGREEGGLVGAATSPHRTPSCSWRPRPTRGRGKGGGRPCWRRGSTSPHRSQSCLWRSWPTRGRGEGGGRPCRLCSSTAVPRRSPSCSWRPWPMRGKKEGGGRPCLRRGSTIVPQRSPSCSRLVADEGERGGRRMALLVPYPLCTEMPSPLLALMASITLKAHMLLLPLVISRPPIAGCIRASRHYISRLFLGSFLFTSLSKREDCSMTPCRVGAGDERDDRGLTDESRITVFALPFSLSQTDRVIGAQVEKSRGSENFSG